jgi:hypothetical protein
VVVSSERAPPIPNGFVTPWTVMLLPEGDNMVLADTESDPTIARLPIMVFEYIFGAKRFPKTVVLPIRFPVNVEVILEVVMFPTRFE